MHRVSSRASDTRELLLVNHLAGHPAIDDEIGSGYEARPLAVDEKGDDLGDVLRLAYSAGRMLQLVFAPQSLFILTPHDDPARADAVDPHVWSKADGERMGQRDEP